MIAIITADHVNSSLDYSLMIIYYVKKGVEMDTENLIQNCMNAMMETKRMGMGAQETANSN